MDVTYEWSDVQIQHLYDCVCHRLRHGLLGKLFLILPSSPQTKSKTIKKHRLQTTALTSRELTAITYNSFGTLQSNKDFLSSSCLGNKMKPGFNCWPLPSPRTRHVRKLTDFFKICLPNVFQCFILKIHITFSFRRSSHIL